MRHMLTNPAFPDIVGEWAAEESRKELNASACANDNETEGEDLSELCLLALIARAEVEATRLW